LFDLLALTGTQILLILLIITLFLVNLIYRLLSHVFLVMHCIEEQAALLELFLDILPVNHHEMPQQLVLILINLSRHWEDQTQ
jgi:hypothetical protein